jgi:hypothetical protein
MSISVQYRIAVWSLIPNRCVSRSGSPPLASASPWSWSARTAPGSAGTRPLDPENLAVQLAELAADLSTGYRPASTGQLSPHSLSVLN